MRCSTNCLIVCIGVMWSCFLGETSAEENERRIKKIKSPQAMQMEIESLRTDNHRWREIRWNRCLLQGLGQSRIKDKPILLWVFLHNPNEERC